MSDTPKTTNSTCSNNNNTNTNKITNNQASVEQPKIKRQKIEKVKVNTRDCKISKESCNTIAANGNGMTTVTLATTTTSPNGTNIIVPTTKRSSILPEEIQTQNCKKQICSSLSSSAQSISSSPCSLNNSPSSTPSSSRATSLSQLLNVASSTPHNVPSNATTSTFPRGESELTVSKLYNNNKNQTEINSTDEVDRLSNLTTLSNMLPLELMEANISKVKPTQRQSSSNEFEREFEKSLIRQCLCGVSEDALQKPFQSHYFFDANGQSRIANLSEWPTKKLLQFLSNLQLLFDIYLKQNSKGFICARIMDVCDALIRNDRNLIDEIIVLAGYGNSYVQFLAGRVLASFLVIAKQELDENWIKKLVDNLLLYERMDAATIQKLHYSLEIIKRVVDWKDIDLHPLEDEIVDMRNHLALNSNSSGEHGQGHVTNSTSLMETQNISHAHMHFRTRQPTLETNYFSAHFQTPESSGSGIVNGIADVNFHETTHQIPEAAATTRTEHSVVGHQQHFENMTNGLGTHRNTVNFLMNTDVEDPTDVINQPTVTSVMKDIGPYTENSVAQSQFSVHTVELHNNGMRAHLIDVECSIVTLTDSESFDTTSLKGITIKILENKWPTLVRNMSTLIANHLNIESAENCVLNFLQLWESIISVKANLSIVETLPFYAQLDKFESLLLNRNLSCTVYKQMLCLFNEALCYGSTLALQDMLPEETCMLAHQIVRHVKDFRILESLPRRQPENSAGLIGFKRTPIRYADFTLQANLTSNNNTTSTTSTTTTTTTSATFNREVNLAIEMDKTILQKMVLLVLKSIAVTVKEIRSDSSDSSIDSTDYDAFQDMVLIERSIRDVLRKLETFIKDTLDFHPECHFSKILIHLFDDQDDHLIEAMVCTLDVTSGISFRNNAFPELVAMLNPVFTFLEFLKLISNSSDLLLDLLVSNETCFLLYLLRFLKYIRMNWSMFVESCERFGNGTNTLEDAMSVLIRLRLQISRLVSRQLYPYDISPVLRLLESCECLYEGDDLS